MTFWFSSNQRRASQAFEICFREAAIGKVADKCEEVYIHEAIASIFRFCYLKRWVEDGSRKGASNP